MPKKAENYQRLFKTMAEELKLPLLQVARQAELAALGDPATGPYLLQQIEQSASQALWLVDSYLLGQEQLELEPVAVSAALDDAAQALDGLAKQYNCRLELQISGRYQPVMAHRRALQTALVGLGSSLITATQAGDQPQSLILAAHRGHNGGVVAGIFSTNEGLSQDIYARGRALYGRAHQPLHQLTAQAGAGIFIADALFSSMAAQLRVARHHNLTGLAATLPTSHQLALI